MRRPRRCAWWISSLMLLVLGAGCSASSADYRAEPSYNVAQAYTEHEASYAPSPEPYRPSGVSLTSARAVAGERSAPPAPTTEQSQAAAVKRKFIRTASLTLEVPDEDDFKPTLVKAGKIAEDLEGYIQHESTRGVTLMVPTDKLDVALKALEALGEVTSREVRVVDVTAQYVDMQIRIANLRRMRDRLTELVAQSTDVSEILKIETELGRVTAELERMEGQLRLMDRNTTYATVTIWLQERVSPGPLGWVFYGLYRGVKWLFVWD